ncbi:hypothetical protein OG225_26290 [Nocardia sp. NBC_01377]
MDLVPTSARAYRGAIGSLVGRDRPVVCLGGNLGDVGQVRRFRFTDRRGEAGAMAGHAAFDRLAEVVPDVPSVGDLHCVRRSGGDPLGVGAATVAAYDLDAWMGSQPGREGGGGPVVEDLDRAAGHHIDQDRSVVVPATQGEVIDTQHVRDRDHRIGKSADLAQQSHPTHRRGQLLGQPRSSATTQCQPDRAQRTLQDQSAAAMPGGQLWHLLSESRFTAVGIATEESADPQRDHHFPTGDRGIRQPASIPAVDPDRGRPAAGTSDRILAGRSLDPHRRSRRTDHIDLQTVQMWEQNPHQTKIRTPAT